MTADSGLIGIRAGARRSALVLCTTSDCKLAEFLVRLDAGIDFEFMKRVTGNLVDLVVEKDPHLIIVHANGHGYSSWVTIIDDLNEALGAPIVVLVEHEREIQDYVEKVDMTIMTPRKFQSRIQFVSSLYCLANGVSPLGSSAAPVVVPGTQDHQAVFADNKSLLRLIEWTLALSLLLSSLVAMVVLLVKEDVQAATTAFATIFSSTIAAFTSGGVVRLLRRWKRLRNGSHPS